MTQAFVAVVLGLALLVWSADRFVEGSASAARQFGMPPLLIGMVIVGFGTSAPEMVVSALAASQGNAGIALGNARIEHHQYRSDPRAHGNHQSDRRSFPGAAQGVGSSYACHRTVRMADIGR